MVVQSTRHEYALLYGTPVPGYDAPQTTMPSATRVTALLIGLLDAVATEKRDLGHDDAPAVPRPARAAFASARALMGPGPSDDLIVRGIAAWSCCSSAISLELFGHRTAQLIGMVFFDLEITGWRRSSASARERPTRSRR